MDGIGGQIHGIRDQNAERNLDGAIVNSPLHIVDDPAGEEAEPDAAEGEPDEHQDATGHGGHAPVHDNIGSELKGEQARGVVDQAFSFENVDDAAGKSDTSCDGCSRDRVGGGDDGSEHQPDTPVEAGEGIRGHQGNCENGESHQPEGQKKDIDEVVAEVAPGGEPRGGVEKRRENDQEDQVGVEGNPGDARDETESQPSDDHDDRVRSSQFSSEESEDYYEKKQKKKHEFNGANLTHSTHPIL